jgi:hypothetical protein
VAVLAGGAGGLIGWLNISIDVGGNRNRQAINQFGPGPNIHTPYYIQAAKALTRPGVQGVHARGYRGQRGFEPKSDAYWSRDAEAEARAARRLTVLADPHA